MLLILKKESQLSIFNKKNYIIQSINYKTMKNLKTVYNFSKKFTGYGHWEISVEIDNEKYDSESDNYDEKERKIISYTTTNSMDIDAGNMRSLAEECLIKNKYNDEEFDLSELSSGEVEEEN